MQDFTKTHLDIQGQIALLKSRGMLVSSDEKTAICLTRISYYRLSAYWYPFRESELKTSDDQKSIQVIIKDEFRSDTNFDEIVDFYVFDKNLRLLISDALERIEIALRAQIADLLASYGSCAHRDTSALHGNFLRPSKRDDSKSKHEDWLTDQDRNFDRSREDFAKHFKSKYGSATPPIWIAKEVWDWGMLSHLFSGMKHKDREAIAGTYSVGGDVFATWLRMLNDIRNICAHHSRLWNRGLVSQPRIPTGEQTPELDHLRGVPQAIGRVYGALVITVFLMKKLHPASEWHRRLADHIGVAPKNDLISILAAGFPISWRDQDIWS